jgi:hypothetical protein
VPKIIGAAIALAMSLICIVVIALPIPTVAPHNAQPVKALIKIVTIYLMAIIEYG